MSNKIETPLIQLHKYLFAVSSGKNGKEEWQKYKKVVKKDNKKING